MKQLPPARPVSPVLLLFSIGFTAQLAQIVLFRELLTTFSGSEIAVAWLLGCWLVWTGAGSCLAQWRLTRISHRSRRAGQGRADIGGTAQTDLAQLGALSPASVKTATEVPPASWWYLAATVLIVAVMPLEIVGIRGLRAVCGVASGQSVALSTLFVSSLLMLAPLGISLGAQFVLGVRLVRSAEGVYVSECVGSAAAGLLASCLLVPWLDSFSLVFLAAAVHLLTASLLLLPAVGRRAKVLVFAPLAAVIALSCLAGRLDEASRRLYWRLFNPQMELVASRESPYGSIAVLRRGDQFNIYQSGRLLFSLPDQGESAPLAQLCMAQQAAPRKVLLIGAGISGVLKEVVRNPVDRVDYVEIDPVLIDMARPYLASSDLQALDDGRVCVHHEDGRAFTRQTAERFDLVIVNAPDPTTAQSNRYYTREFLTEVRRCLAPNGVLCLGPVATMEMCQPEDMLRRNGTIYATLRSVFRNVLATSGGACYFFASDAEGSPTLDIAVIAGRLAAHGIELVDFTPLVDEFYVGKVNYELRTGRLQSPFADENAPDALLPWNTDARPIVYFQSILLWLHATDDKSLLALLTWLHSASLWWLAAPLGIILAATLLPASRRAPARSWPRANRIIAFGVLVGGLSGMALEIMAILAFQNAVGAIYQRVGLMFALFMLGMAAGAESARRMTDVRKSRRRLLMLEVIFGLVMLAAPWLLAAPAWLGIAAVEVFAFGAVNLLSGALVGLLYPLAVEAADEGAAEGATGVSPVPPAAGMLYAYDLLGGALGSLLVGALLLPLFGVAVVAWTCATMSFLAASLLLLVIGRRKRASPILRN